MKVEKTFMVKRRKGYLKA